jgi:type II secretory pathway pseudopilin PulG
MKQRARNTNQGFTSLEVVIGVSIAATVLIFAMYTINSFINSARDVTEKTQALYLAEEGLELVRFIRDENWSNISALPVSTTRYLAIATSTISATTTPEVLGAFTRSFQMENVYRNTTTDDIVASTTGGSVADTGSKYVRMTVSWGTPTKSVALTTIITDLAP